jgi:hypothetical protein
MKRQVWLRIVSLGALIVGLLSAAALATPTTPTFAQDPTSTPLVGSAPNDVCENAPALQLRLGQKAKVVASLDPELPGAHLKAGPDLALPVARYLPLDTIVTVGGGPTCDKQDNQWWQVRVGQLEGWVTETFGDRYILEPLTGTEPPSLVTTSMIPLSCVAPSGKPPTPKPDLPLLRVVFANADGSVFASDNGDLGGRQLAKFDPPPTHVDLSPDGAAVAVTNRNGVYWVDARSGETVMLLDATTLTLAPKSWFNRALWLPNGVGLAIEVEDRSSGVVSFAIYSFPMDGTGESFRVDSGAQPPNSLRRSPPGSRLVMLSANDVSPFPKNIDDDVKGLIEFTPISEKEDAFGIFSPAVTWSTDGTGFYTYIPAGQFTAPEDTIVKHLWYVALDGPPKDLGVPPNIAAGEYVIPSPDGEKLLLGRGGNWRIQAAATGTVLARLPAIEYLFDWTPDSQGAVYSTPASVAAFIGVDGGTTSKFLPAGVRGLYGVRWLADGSTLYLVQRADGTFGLGLQQPGQTPALIGDVAGTEAYSGSILFAAPPTIKPPQACQ